MRFADDSFHFSHLRLFYHYPYLHSCRHAPHIHLLRLSDPRRLIAPPHISCPANSQWVTSKEALGLASSTKRPTSCVMIAKVGMKKKVKEGETEKEGAAQVETEFQGLYVEAEAEIAEL